MDTLPCTGRDPTSRVRHQQEIMPTSRVTLPRRTPYSAECRVTFPLRQYLGSKGNARRWTLEGRRERGSKRHANAGGAQTRLSNVGQLAAIPVIGRQVLNASSSLVKCCYAIHKPAAPAVTTVVACSNAYTSWMSCFFSGIERMRLPVAAKYAFSTAGAATQTGGSPTPPQNPPEGMMIDSTFGICAMRIES
jgi:hypothetical protein